MKFKKEKGKKKTSGSQWEKRGRTVRNKSEERVRRIIQHLLGDKKHYKGNAKEDLHRFWRSYLGPYKLKIVAASVISIIGGSAALFFSIVHRFLVDRVFLPIGPAVTFSQDERLRLLSYGIGVFFLIWMIMLLGRLAHSGLILRVGQNVVFMLRKDLNEKLQSLHIGFFERTPTGRIIARVLDDVNVIYRWIVHQNIMLVTSVGKLVIGVGVALYINWQLALMGLIAWPLYAYTFVRLRPVIRELNIAMRQVNSQIYALSAERINGIQVVKGFSQEGRELRRFSALVFNLVRVASQLMTKSNLLTLISSFIMAVMTGGMIAFTVFGIKAGRMTAGDLIAFYGLMPNMLRPLNMITSVYAQFEGVLVVIRRMFGLLDEEEEVIPGHVSLHGMTGKVKFDHVTFCYPLQKKPALSDISFMVNQGERVGIMGPSGSGKSTLFQLLLRFYDPQEGAVRVGGVNLVDAEPSSIRHHVRMVQQEPEVFSGSVADNIAFGHLDAEAGSIMAAAKQAELHDFIMTLPVKYETEVGEKGVLLSGGQKQRLSLAAALLTKPEILLLDDTTSALDAETESKIRTTLNHVLHNRTSLIITQRISTAKDCDRIIVLENGIITQDGTHESLRKEKGFYRKICRKQGYEEIE